MENDNDPRVCKGKPPPKEVNWFVVPTDCLQKDKEGKPTLLLEKSTKMAVVKAQIAFVAWQKAAIPSMLGIPAEQLTANEYGFVKSDGINVELVIEEGIDYGKQLDGESQFSEREVFSGIRPRLHKSSGRNGIGPGRNKGRKGVVRSRNKKEK